MKDEAVKPMTYELKAEYEFRDIQTWHVVPEGGARSLCGRPLAPAASTSPIAELMRKRDACPVCAGALALLRDAR